MNKLIRLVLLILCLTYPMLNLGAQMNLLNPDARLEKFKKKIKFDEILAKELITPLYTAVNVDPTRYSQFEGWLLSSKNAQNRGDELFYEWIFKKSKESVLIQIYLSPKSVAETRKRFLDAADSTSTMEIPFEKGPDDIGTLSAIPHHTPYDYIIFVNRNIYVHVKSYESAIDTLAISKLINKQITNSR
jgi:hypothetical protein